jgi:RNA polymerase sigma factor (sigma-70 family)
LSDTELIQNLMRNKEMDPTIRYLYATHFELLSRYVVNNSGKWEDAEDVFQEVIISFVNLVKAGKFRGESSVKTFLFALNRNIWLNELKRRGRAEIRETKYETAKEENDDRVDLVMENREAVGELMKTVEALGSDCKKILVLYYYENQSMKEILLQMHYENEQVVRNKKYKCLKRLEEMVSGNKNLYSQLKNFLHG